MARIKFKDFVPRPKPKKRPRRHAKSVSKKEYQIKKSIEVKVDEDQINVIQILDYHFQSNRDYRCNSYWSLFAFGVIENSTNLETADILFK